MKSDVQDVEALSRAILNEAHEESDQIRADAKEKVEVIKRRAEAQAAEERKAILDRANQDAERVRGQATAGAQLQARSTQLVSREKLLDQVFAAVRKQLDDVKKRPDYDDIATRLLREALTALRVEKAEVRADDATQKILMKGGADQLAKELNGTYTFGAPLEHGTGVVVSAANARVQFDNTLETRLERLQGSLRAAAYRVLMGEKA